MSSESAATPRVAQNAEIAETPRVAQNAEIAATPRVAQNAEIAVPAIVITEASPLPPTMETPVHIVTPVVDTVPSAIEDDISQTVEQETEMPPEIPEQKKAENVVPKVVDGSGEGTSEQCVVSVEVEDTVVDMPLNEDSEVNDFMTTRGWCCPFYGGFGGFHYWLSEMFDSKYSLPFWIMLFALPLSSGYMGAKYKNDCPMDLFSTYCIFMFGVTGVIALTFRMLLIMYNIMYEEEEECRFCLRGLLMISSLIVFVLFITQFLLFWQDIPSDDPKAKNYCHPVYYRYIFWFNCVTGPLVVFYTLVKIPSCRIQHHNY